MTPDALAIERRLGSGTYRHRDLTLVRGHGCRVFDDEGREYLDGTSMYGVTSLGHAHPAVTRALTEQAERLVACFSTFANDARARLLETMTEVFTPFERFFLCNSGTEAVEAALKTARLVTGRTGIVALQRGFHGRTMGALSTTHRLQHRKPFLPLLEGVTFVDPLDEEALDDALAAAPAAVIFEPIQGEGGVHELPEATLQRLRERTRARDVLLIADEVQTGCGRTGAWLASTAAGIEPDLVCLAKGLGGGVPIGALAMGSGIEALPAGSHGSTFGGNPLSCAAANATLTTLRDEDIPSRVAALGARALQRLRAAQHPVVREVRGRGFLLGVELRTRVGPLLRTLQERGFLVLSAGSTVLRLLPPLVMEEDELDRLVDAVNEALAAAGPRERAGGTATS